MKNSIFLILLLFISSCCDSDLINTISFTQDELAVNPYNGSEVLIFKDDSGKTITYSNGYRRSTTEKVSECDGGCCDYYNLVRNNIALFESTYMESNLQVIIVNDFDKYTGTKGSPLISFAWCYYENTPLGVVTSFGGLPVDSVKEKALAKGWYRDTIYLRNRLFYDVISLPGNCSKPDKLHGDTIYFSETEGIVGLRFSDGNLWVIQ